MSAAIAFLTGLTAGGLGCLAVQGGLLTSSCSMGRRVGHLVFDKP